MHIYFALQLFYLLEICRQKQTTDTGMIAFGIRRKLTGTKCQACMCVWELYSSVHVGTV